MPTSLLLACLSSAPDPALSDRLSQLSESDWQALLQVATRHGILPLLYHRLTSASPLAQSRSTHHQSPASVPHSAFRIPQSLLEAFLLNAARNTLLYQDLAQVLTHLQSHGIRVAVLKGAHLAALVYPHIGLRPMADLDMLVDKGSLSDTADQLRAMGYDSDRSKDIESQARSGKHLKGFFKPLHPRVEVHWTISDSTLPFEVDMAGVVSRLRPVEIAGLPVLVLSHEDLLLHLCIHAAGHTPVPFCHGIRTFCDLAAVIQHHRHELDWTAIQMRAVEWRAGKGVYVTLRLAAELVQADVSPAVLAALRPADFDETGYALAREQALLQGEETPAPAAGLDDGRFQTLVKGTTAISPAARLKFLLRTIVPTQAHMAIYMDHFHSVPLTGHRKYTCYLTRAWDLTGKCFSLLLHGATHRRETAARARQWQKEAQLTHWMLTPDSLSAQAPPSLPVSESPSTNHQSPPPSTLCHPPPIPTSSPVLPSALPTRRSAPASLSSSPEERAGVRSRSPSPPVPPPALRAPGSALATHHWFDWPWSIRWALLLTYLGLVTWMSLMPASTIARFPMPFHFRYEDKVVHFLFYGGLVALGRWTLATHWTIRPTVWPVVVGAIGYGVMMEILQSLMVSYGRAFEFGDIAANTCGALSFWWLSRFLFRPHPPAPAVPS